MSSPTRGKYGPNRKAWLHVDRREYVLYQVSEQDSDDGAPAVILRFNPRPASLALTALTEQELEALQGFLNEAFDLARPICIALDAEAKRAYERGEDADRRLYRTVPEVVRRLGSQPE